MSTTRSDSRGAQHAAAGTGTSGWSLEVVHRTCHDGRLIDENLARYFLHRLSLPLRHVNTFQHPSSLAVSTGRYFFHLGNLG